VCGDKARKSAVTTVRTDGGTSVDGTAKGGVVVGGGMDDDDAMVADDAHRQKQLQLIVSSMEGAWYDLRHPPLRCFRGIHPFDVGPDGFGHGTLLAPQVLDDAT